jgi:hypothetical protein
MTRNQMFQQSLVKDSIIYRYQDLDSVQVKEILALKEMDELNRKELKRTKNKRTGWMIGCLSAVTYIIIKSLSG